MAESYSVEAILSVYDKGYTAGMEKAAAVARGLDNQTQTSGMSALKMGGAFGIASALVGKGMSLIQNSLGGAINRFDTLNKYPVVMKALGYSAQDVAKSTKILSNGIDGLPTSLDEITASAQQLGPLVGSADKAAKSAISLNNAFLASGASVGDTSRGLQQYTQMLSTGKVDMMSWRTLMETMPIALRKVANSFGYTGKSAETDLYDALKSGKISVEDLNDAFIKLNQGQGGFADLAKKNSAGIGTSFANLRASVVKNLGNMLTSINDGFAKAGFGSIAQQLDNLKFVINDAFKAIGPVVADVTASILTKLKGVIDWANQNKDWLAPMAKGILGAVVASKGLSVGLKLTEGALGGVSKGFAIFNKYADMLEDLPKAISTFKNAFSTAYPIVSKVASVLGSGLVKALSLFGKGLKTGAILAWKGAVLLAKGTANLFKLAVSGVKKALVIMGSALKTGAIMAWNGAVKIAQATMVGFRTGLNLVKTAFVQLGAVIMANPLVAIVVAITAVVAALTWFFTQTQTGQALWQSFTTWLTGAWQTLVSVASTVWNTISTAISTAWTTVSNIVMTGVSAVVGFWSTAWNTLVSVVSAVWSGITTAFGVGIGFVQSVVSMGVSAVKSVWNAGVNTLRTVASSVWGTIKGVFSAGVNFIRSVVHVDLSGAGQAIMNSLLAGLKAAWGAVKGFVSGIAGWIKKHKGPISYDKRLLIPAGNAIMTGLNVGLTSSFSDVQATVSNIASAIADGMSVQASPDIQMNGLSRLSNLGRQAFDANYSGSMQLQGTTIEQENNRLLKQIANKRSDVYLDGKTLVGGTLGENNRQLGGIVQLQGRWS